MPKEKQKRDMVNTGFTVQRELWERFRELCGYRGESVSDTLHKLIEQWVMEIESMKIDSTRKTE
jgi:ParG protein